MVTLSISVEGDEAEEKRRREEQQRQRKKEREEREHIKKEKARQELEKRSQFPRNHFLMFFLLNPRRESANHCSYP